MNEKYRVIESDKLFSPSLLFYKEQLLTNITKAVSIAGNPNRLRPHVKTHKTKEIVKLCLQAGIQKFKCATIAEAEMLAQCGVKDVLLAYTLVGPNLLRFVTLMQRYPNTTFRLLVDSTRAAHQLSELAQKHKLQVEVFLDIDPGLHRTGVEPGEEAVELIRYLHSLANIKLIGIHCYDGHNHEPDRTKREAEGDRIYEAVQELLQKVQGKETDLQVVVLGGTPSFPVYAKYTEVELSPGTCFLQDWNYLSNYPDLDFLPAALVFSRVVSVHKGSSTFTLDLGYKGIASDPKGARGKILNLDRAEPLFQNEEHWVFRMEEGTLPDLGTEVYVLPTHICPTCALYDEASVVDDQGRILGTWEITARRRRLTI